MRSETLTGTGRQNVFTHRDISDRSFWIGLGVIVAVGLLTRLLDFLDSPRFPGVPRFPIAVLQPYGSV